MYIFVVLYNKAVAFSDVPLRTERTHTLQILTQTQARVFDTIYTKTSPHTHTHPKCFVVPRYRAQLKKNNS